MDRRRQKRIIEAALFNSPGSVKVGELSKMLNENIAEVRIIVNELIHEYEAKDTALEIRDSFEGVKMAVKPEYEQHVSHMAASPEMHKSMLKTLAFIAYRQPVKQSEVIRFRNSKAYEHIGVLLEKGFIKKEKKGITFIVSTTPKFREYFGTSLGKKTENIKDDTAETKTAEQAE